MMLSMMLSNARLIDAYLVVHNNLLNSGVLCCAMYIIVVINSSYI